MVRIITDSSCDIPRSRMEELDIDIVPLSIFFDETEYQDGITISPTEFYTLLANSKKLPTTSQPSPEAFFQLFQKYVDGGDQVVGLFMSSQISGTFQSATIAKDLVGHGEIYLIDSQNATMALAILIYEAIRLREEGHSAKEIFHAVSQLPDKLVLYAAVNNLKYLKMGGRISGTVALIGGALGISPIVTMAQGKISSIGKTRGKAQTHAFFLEKLQAEPADTRYLVHFAHSNFEEGALELESYLSKELTLPHTTCGGLGGTIGTHAGPGAVGLAYIKQ